MGLDIYLKKYEDFEDSQRRAEFAEAAVNEMYSAYPSYEQMTESQKQEAGVKRKEIYASFGLSDWGEDPLVHRIEQNSEKYPDHIFKVGYWRSSYNEGGISRVLGRTIGSDLYSICQVQDTSEYIFRLDWEAVRENALDAREELKGHGYDVVTPSFYASDVVTGQNQALEVFLKELSRGRVFDSYSSKNGEFFLGEPLKVSGIIPGEKTVHLIIKSDFSFYEQALEIIAETCEYVLAQPDVEKYYVYWSA